MEPALWLRAALMAALVAAACVTVFDLTVSERVVDRAVAREHGAKSAGALAVPEQFTRNEQRGGLVLAELLYAVGVALVVAGIAILLGRTSDAPRRWLALSAAGVWSLVVMPALVLPPLPPGAAVVASVEARRATFAAAAAIGILGCAGAGWAWRSANGKSAGVRLLLSTAIVAASAIVVVAVLPADRLVEPVETSLLRDFRLASFGSQALFWVACAGGGAWVLRRAGTGGGT